MLILALFWALTLASCGYAACCGGWEGRCAAAMIVAAAVLSVPAAHLDNTVWSDTEFAVLAVDTAFLGGLVWLTLRSPRWWPIWMTAFQLLAVLSHVGTLLARDFLPGIYFALASVWAIPLPIAMTLGVWRDRRAAKPT